MIITKTIKSRINNKNSKHYKELGYDISNFEIEIPVNDLPRNSSKKIKVACGYCLEEKDVFYKSYMDSIEGGKKYACKKCFSLKYKETFLEKYGVENASHLIDVKEKKKKTNMKNFGVEHFSKTKEYQDKKSKTMFERWGTEHALQSSEIKSKFKQTMLERWGVEHPSYSNDIKEKIKKTNLENFGVDNPFKSYDIKEKIKKTNLENFGVYWFVQSDEFKMKSRMTNLEKYDSEIYSKSLQYMSGKKIAKHDNYIKYIDSSKHLFQCINGHEFEISIDNYYSRLRFNTPLCTVCNPIGDSKSIKEKELFDYIQSIYNGEIIQSYRDGLEIDIYLPDLKIGFEFNGLYWHSELYKDKWYHINKTNHFKERGIRIIHIWEDDWVHKRNIIKSQIVNWLVITNKRIFARNCYVREIKDSKIVSRFLNDNHIQGKVNSNLKLGLFYDDELISLMTFDQFEGRKKMEDGGWCINRFCNKLNTNIIGGASKLLKSFIRSHNVKRIVSYADRDWSNGRLYEKLGFNKISESSPDYKYIIDNKRENKQGYKKKNLKITDITESKFMRDNGFLKIWDCGKIKYEIKL